MSKSVAFKPVPPVTSDEFALRLEQLVQNFWLIQDRLIEISEFEKQWEELFSKL